MSDLAHREELELRFKTELDQAEQELRNATLENRDEARKRFREALHNFSALVLEGKLPPEYRANVVKYRAAGQ